MATRAEIDKFLAAIMGFESGGDAKAQNPYASASGLFGYIDATWNNYGGYRHARDAPASVQWSKAREDVAGKLRAYGGDFRKVAMAWYYPAWVNDPSKHNTVPAPEYGNTKTLAQYADLVMGRFTSGNYKPQAGPVSSGGGTAPSATGTGGAAKTPSTPQEIEAYIRDNYPDVYGLLQIDAEVKAVLFKAAKNKWGLPELTGALSKTKYYKRTAAAARTWDTDQDNATKQEKLRRSREQVATLARQMGVTLSAGFLDRMALNINRLGWTEQMVRQSVGAQFRQKTATAGQGTATVDALRVLAAQYAVPISDITLTNWTRDILSGYTDENAFRSFLVKKAKQANPLIADEISEGLTVQDYFSDYGELAAQLGVIANPNEFDLSNSKWRRAIYRTDEKTGKPNAIRTLDEWETELRTNDTYGFRYTRRGRSEADEFVRELEQALGAPG